MKSAGRASSAQDLDSSGNKRYIGKFARWETDDEDGSRGDAEITEVQFFFSASSAPPREPVLTRDAENNYNAHYVTSP
jgi:hypothetical protein